jgi:hypothetical protein
MRRVKRQLRLKNSLQLVGRVNKLSMEIIAASAREKNRPVHIV